MIAALTSESDGEAVEYTEEAIDAALSERDENIEKTVIDGKTYYTVKEDITENMSTGSDFIITADTFVLKNTNEDQLAIKDLFDSSENASDAAIAEYLTKSINYTFSITMPSKIILTNGTLSDDKKTVTFSFDMEKYENEYYAYTKGADSIIDVSGLDGKYTKKNGITVNFSDDLSGSESAKLNGKR